MQIMDSSLEVRNPKQMNIPILPVTLYSQLK